MPKGWSKKAIKQKRQLELDQARAARIQELQEVARPCVHALDEGMRCTTLQRSRRNMVMHIHEFSEETVFTSRMLAVSSTLVAPRGGCCAMQTIAEAQDIQERIDRQAQIEMIKFHVGKLWKP